MTGRKRYTFTMYSLTPSEVGIVRREYQEKSTKLFKMVQKVLKDREEGKSGLVARRHVTDREYLKGYVEGMEFILTIMGMVKSSNENSICRISGR